MAQDPLLIELGKIAAEQHAGVVAALPSDPVQRFLVFMEAMRMLDYWTAFQPLLPLERRPGAADLDLIHWGWNPAIAELFSGIDYAEGVPATRSTPDKQAWATNMLHQFGQAVLVRRTAEMVRTGILQADWSGKDFVLRTAESISSQCLDLLELDRWERIGLSIDNSREPALNGWNFFHAESEDFPANRIGAFLGRRSTDERDAWMQKDIDALMRPLIFPFNTGHATVLGYGADAAVDNHFFADASHRSIQWRDEVGLDPKATFCGTDALDVIQVSACMASFHAKHVRFAALAMKDYPEISIIQSLTIWDRREKLIDAIAQYSGWELARVDRALRAVTLSPGDSKHLCNYSSPIVPLLFDTGNGFVLRPISSISRNPLKATIRMLDWREPSAMGRLGGEREKWFRSDLYALFKGNRYKCIEGSTKIRNGGRELTDIDAAIFDRNTGDIALFQLKWQDFFTSDVRRLRSKSSNLVRELEEWAATLSKWIFSQGQGDVAKCFRLNRERDGAIARIFYFGISRDMARVQGYGFAVKNPYLAVGTWSHFKRLRFECGPSRNVLDDMHRILHAEMDVSVRVTPTPFEIMIAGRKFRFDDMWTKHEEQTPNS